MDAGKRICLGGCPNDPDVIRKLFKAFPKEEFFIPLTFDSEANAVKMIESLLSFAVLYGYDSELSILEIISNFAHGECALKLEKPTYLAH